MSRQWAQKKSGSNSSMPVQKSSSKQRPSSDPIYDAPAPKQTPSVQGKRAFDWSRVTVEAPSRAGVQAKLSFGATGDKYEPVADAIATKVMTMPAPENQEPEGLQTAPEEKKEDQVQAEQEADAIAPLVQRDVTPEEEQQEVQAKSLETASIQRDVAPGEEQEDQLPVQAKVSAAESSQTSDNLENQLNASKGGGSPLADEVRAFAEPRFGADFSHVRVHTDAASVQMNKELGAQAFAHGSDIYYGAGKSPGKDELTAHELTHVVQQTGAAIKRYQSTAISTDQNSGKLRRFGAGKHGHGGIEAEAASGQPELAAGDPKKQGVAEIYSGNFMRDMNQLNVPKVIEALEGLPKDVTSPKGAKIGAKGSHDITTAVIQALAILEFGPQVADTLVTGGEINPKSGKKTADNIGAYRPEEHIDNPMGTGAADIVVANTNPNAKDKEGTKIEIGAPRVALPVVGPTDCPVDKDRDQQLQGSAIKGLQVENPDLYKVSGSGLTNHIYNSVEATKKRWLKAAALGATPQGRSEFGAGSHAVEDYFSHSNFVEVALNSYITNALQHKGKQDENRTATQFAEKVIAQNNKQGGTDGKTAQGYYVDTLYDEKKADPKNKGKQRQAVTTGTFGGDDTMVSIAHILMPQLPKLQGALLSCVDMMFGIAREGGEGGWSAIKAALSSEPAGAAGAKILEGFSNAGMVAPVPDIELEWKSIPISPGLIGKPWTVELPTGLKHLTSSVPITDAVSTYAGIYKKANQMIALVQKYAAYAKKLLLPIDWLIEAINAEVKKIEQEIKKAIKAQVVAGLVSIIDSLSGRSQAEKEKAKKEGKPLDPKDPNAEFNKDLGDALHYFHEKVEEIEEKTSIESRLKNGDLSKMPKAQVESLVGSVEEVKEEVINANGKPGVRKYYKSLKPLPPSHSEISKDHEPHSEHDKKGGDGDLNRHHDEGEEPGHEKGSPFFGLARSLAVEAVKHSEAQLQVVWANHPGEGDKSLFGDGQMYQYKNKSAPDQSKKIHDQLLSEADKRAKEEKERSAKEGTYLTQRDAQGQEAETMKRPGVGQLMNIVDLFISHPDDTQWWKPIFDAYIATDAESVYESILRRNKTRSSRNLK
ncbi:eCIS core domain-containing protein [Microseira wollei]|uniref:OmpA/MotB domain-containing protein n=1 Tax=Microseira wollei NIES-4236 TaxID=2530354 RepID=A0AAV3X928_9CYAN|nr:DUF4157 domain-containing protein [Microseira wollei]GET36580.1 OmpA/MotB domain-containing protein [Microseira wollei NIES-4236]